MNNLKQFLIDSVRDDYAQAFDNCSKETQQQLTMKLAEIYTLLGHPQQAQQLTAPIRKPQARHIEAQALAAQGMVDKATQRYLEAFQLSPTAASYKELAAMFEQASQREDAAYYDMMAQKMNAYGALAALQAQGATVLEQARQMLEHPTSFDGWLQSVIRLNDEELAIYTANDAPRIEEPKRSAVKPTIVVAAPIAEAATVTEDVPPAPVEQVIQPTIQPAMTPPPQQPSPYADPKAFIAAQERARADDTANETNNEELNDFESMYFGEMYED